MNRTWRFTALEFEALWSRSGLDIPRPFVLVTDIPYEEDYQRELRSIRQRWRSNDDPAFDRICRDVNEPDLSLVVRGIDGRDPRNARGTIRMLGVRREDRGYLVAQLPGETVHHPAGFTVTECDPPALAGAVVECLPKVEAGRQSRITLPMPQSVDEMDHSYSDSGVWDSFDDAGHAADRFQRAVPSMLGAIEVCQGFSLYGPRGRVSFWLEWRDLPDDGRYVIGSALPPVAEPADAKRFTAMINVEIAAVIRTIRDERSGAGLPASPQ
ncbi:ESX secretion-associated protein EspG [Nocardia grenadensis]|uniref:ESX secretion-associated protein EspG n=1 Tax=Nocardia grenadensis TaxID=931537 RepID=UPI0007A4F02F|nr:ESX secretion-associated protein EspG [Nocardia grenadensis]